MCVVVKIEHSFSLRSSLDTENTLGHFHCISGKHGPEAPFSSLTIMSLCSQTQSVNLRGPYSLSRSLARCQTTFLLQLPFLTSAALTWFLLTVVRNLFSFSLMKYYTEAPGSALLYVFFVIPWLSLCFQFVWLLFYCGAPAATHNICRALMQSEADRI